MFVQILVLLFGLVTVTPEMDMSKREGYRPDELLSNNWWKLMSQIYMPGTNHNVAPSTQQNTTVTPWQHANIFWLTKFFIKFNRLRGKCGRTNVPPPDVSRYNNGEAEVQRGQFPWQVALSSTPDVRSSVFCGGSYITPSRHGNVTVLTAAHCVKHFIGKGRKLYVTFNLHDRSDLTNSTTWVATRILMHPNSTRYLMHDVALVFFDRPVSDMVAEAKPVCLSGGVNMNDTGFVSGWGTKKNRPDSPMSRKLKFASVKFVPLHECQQAYARYGRITGDMLCAGTQNGDACQGDDGGPLAVYSGGIWSLTGVVSWGYGCKYQGYPGVFASVPKHVDWIIANL